MSLLAFRNRNETMQPQTLKENMPKKSTRYPFVLKGVSLREIDDTYGFAPEGSIGTKICPKNSTKLPEVGGESDTPEVISFIDEAGYTRICQVSMVDLESGQDPATKYQACFWCRAPLDVAPIGCPIRYVPAQAIKTYHSEVSREVNTIKENITPSQRKLLQQNGASDSRTSVTDQDYVYETDGAFCSFNCCQHWIHEHKHDRLYDQSERLLSRIYNELTNSTTGVIQKAPHWRQKKEYGGNLDSMEFRESFNRVAYPYHGTHFRPMGFLYEERIHF